MADSRCPLCASDDIIAFSHDKRRNYWQCQCCTLVYAQRDTILSADAELAQYQLHQNNLDDPHYRQFLTRLAQPLLQHLPRQAMNGLDFGCGPGPLLAKMLSEAGHNMAVWDPFFAADSQVLTWQYDFICCTEAIEHFTNPGNEWALWQRLLKPEGVLAIMTKRYTDAKAFAGWHYKNDPTHISFFSEQTFHFLAQRDGYSLSFPSADVVIFTRQKH